jgi:hypothetical protein
MPIMRNLERVLVPLALVMLNGLVLAQSSKRKLFYRVRHCESMLIEGAFAIQNGNPERPIEIALRP